MSDEVEAAGTALSPSGVHSAHASTISQWREVAGSRFVPLRVLGEPEFEGSIRWRAIEGACLSEIVANPHTVMRTESLISRVDPKHLKVSLQIEGCGLVAQDGREAVLRPGDIAIYDTSRPYTLTFTDDVRCLVMAFPHDDFEVPTSLVARITAIRFPGDRGLGSVVSPFMQHLAENLDSLHGVSGIRVLHSSLDLLTALVYGQLADEHDHWGEARRAEIRRIKLFIDTHLHDPALNAAMVAKVHFVSIRHLQYLFHEEHLTVSGYIRARRLRHCEIDLSDPAQGFLSVSQIAQRWGFTDASHFSKLFKTHVGMAPRDFRNHKLAEETQGRAPFTQSTA